MNPESRGQRCHRGRLGPAHRARQKLGPAPAALPAQPPLRAGSGRGCALGKVPPEEARPGASPQGLAAGSVTAGDTNLAPGVQRWDRRKPRSQPRGSALDRAAPPGAAGTRSKGDRGLHPAGTGTRSAALPILLGHPGRPRPPEASGQGQRSEQRLPPHCPTSPAHGEEPSPGAASPAPRARLAARRGNRGSGSAPPRADLQLHANSRVLVAS